MAFLNGAVALSAAFVLLATNLAIGFLLILYAILRKNLGGRRPTR